MNSPSSLCFAVIFRTAAICDLLNIHGHGHVFRKLSLPSISRTSLTQLDGDRQRVCWQRKRFLFSSSLIKSRSTA
jgi:hypothetical protein